jgi:hypothetical protein
LPLSSKGKERLVEIAEESEESGEETMRNAKTGKVKRSGTRTSGDKGMAAMKGVLQDEIAALRAQQRMTDGRIDVLERIVEKL